MKASPILLVGEIENSVSTAPFAAVIASVLLVPIDMLPESSRTKIMSMGVTLEIKVGQSFIRAGWALAVDML